MVDHGPKFTFVKRGVFYYSRRVPKGLRDDFGRVRVVACLHTRNPAMACKLAAALSLKLEAIWGIARIERYGISLRPSVVVHPPNSSIEAARPNVRLSDAHALYRRLKSGSKGRAFTVYTDRNMGYAIGCLGDVPIESLTKADAGRFRDHLIAKRLTTASIKRVFATVRSAAKLAISENGLPCSNPFAGTFIPEVGVRTVRQPIPDESLQSVQRACQSVDDEKRWLIALISDTGLRLAEATGLARGDLQLAEPIPCVVVRVHPWRSLKTPSSARTVPLVGASLWAAERLITKASSKFLFPAYASNDGTNANSASAALNKWLRTRLPTGCTVHSFRHSFRDRLRAVECPSDIIDALGGWRTQGIGHAYGKGYPLDILHKWMLRIEAKMSKRPKTLAPQGVSNDVRG